MHKLTTGAAALLLGLGLAGTLHAAELARGDASFLKDAAEAGQLEIATSQVALQKATREDVKAFAKMMVDDHTKVDTELKSLASSKGAQLPAEQPRKVKSKVEDLQKKSGNDFDKDYVDDIAVDAHQDAVKLFEKASKDAKDPDIKAWAAKTLPSLQAHLAKGKDLERAVKNKSSSSAPAMPHAMAK